MLSLFLSNLEALPACEGSRASTARPGKSLSPVLLANRVAQRANAVSAEVGEKDGRQGPSVDYFPCLDLAVWIMRLMAFTYAFALDTMMSLSAPRPV